MQPTTIKAILIAAATTMTLIATPADAGPSRAELLAGRDARVDHAPGSSDRGRHTRGQYRSQDGDQDGGHYGNDRARPESRHHRRTSDRQHHYASARRYAANAVRQARQARHLGYYADHPRWSLNFRRHFEWALRADSYKLEREARKRARKLHELRRYARQPYGYAG